METIFVTESREMLFTGTEDIDVRPLHSSHVDYYTSRRPPCQPLFHSFFADFRIFSRQAAKKKGLARKFFPSVSPGSSPQ